ncbi:AAA family ATPase [Variovorax terrae]|uniref:AAA family ATPase n=1 Tax=Variovorax terrae TaxID=2923278 RepID=A0A9X1VXR1_9BURK|nr:AAA family ATPase [Variovorax terrae]MCJ0765746.1 AAA family ATPase [Variovorax terrae]
MPQPVFFLLAGPNGAGKSSLYRAAVADGLIPETAEFVNADLHERAHLQHVQDPERRSAAAREWADARRAALLAQGKTFVSETVFSHESKLLLIEQAQRSGFLVVLLVVCLDHPQRLLERVRQRVQEGGHDVPADRILARYPRTLAFLARAVRQADMALLYDTGAVPDQDGFNRPVRVATCRKQATTRLVKPLPQWAKTVLSRKPVH